MTMMRPVLISVVYLMLVSAVPVIADCVGDEVAVIYALETSDVACVEGIDCVLDHLEGEAQYPFSDAALGRGWILRGICGDFTLLKLYHQNKGFARLKRAAEERPGDFYPAMWLGASAVESNYLFVSVSAARDYLLSSVEILMGSEMEMRGYFLSYCYYFLGMLEKDTGDLKRALNYWELAVEIDHGGRMAERAANLIDIFTG